MSLSLKRTLGVGSAAVLAVALAACGVVGLVVDGDRHGGSSTSSGSYGDCKITSKPNSISLDAGQGGHADRRDHAAGPGLVERHDAGVDQERLRVLHGRRAREHGGADVGHGQERLVRPAGRRPHQRLRPRPGGDLDHPGAREGRRLLHAVLRLQRRRPGARRAPTSPRTTSPRRRCAAYAGTTSVDFLQNTLKCATTKIYPDSPDALPGRAVGPGRRGLPRHRDRARRGQADQRQARGRRAVQDR